jgi:glycosyltransferase involved in cell wall biosynthesis
VRRTRVAHLTSVHPRADVRIFEKEATSLARAGYEIYIVVGDGLGDELRDGVRVVDIGAAPTGRLRRMLLQSWRVLRRARALRADIYHLHDPELLPVGLALRVRGAQVIYDSHEDLPRAVLSKQWIPVGQRRAIAAVVEWIEDFVVRRLSAVVTATPHIERRFVAVNPLCVAINNYPKLVELALDDAQGPKLARTICYVGGIGRIRGAVEMVRALEYVDARLVLAGSFESAETEAELRALPGWSNVDYRGIVTRQQVLEILAQAQAGLLFFHPEPNHVDAQPNKMFEYMSAGLPVLASDFALWRELLVESGAGLCADPFDPEAIAGVIERLLDDPRAATEMGRRGRDLVLQRYRWEFEERKLEELYRSLPK